MRAVPCAMSASWTCLEPQHFTHRARRQAHAAQCAAPIDTSLGSGAHHTAIAAITKTTPAARNRWITRSEEHTSELQSLMRLSYAVFCSKKKTHGIDATVNNLSHPHQRSDSVHIPHTAPTTAPIHG